MSNFSKQLGAQLVKEAGIGSLVSKGMNYISKLMPMFSRGAKSTVNDVKGFMGPVGHNPNLVSPTIAEQLLRGPNQANRFVLPYHFYNEKIPKNTMFSDMSFPPHPHFASLGEQLGWK